MATVGTLFPTTSASSSPATTSAAESASASNVATDPLASQATFLQLLVAQLQNQDPTQPVDGTTFVTQLAEFSDVEQNLGTRQDLDAVSERYLGVTTPPSETSSATGATTPDASSATGL